MMNKMIRNENHNGLNFLTCPSKNVGKLAEMFDEMNIEFEMFEVGTMPLEKLPEDIQKDVRDILRAFDKAFVVYEYGRFHATTCTCISSEYANDHFVCGTYNQKEVYTEEERRQNYKEEFGEYPCYLN